MTEFLILEEQILSEQTAGPDQVLACVKRQLGLGQIDAARDLLRQALQEHPMSETLQNLQHAIAPGRVEQKSSQYKDRKSELAWIEKNKAEYRHKWVALIGDQAIGVEGVLKVLLDKLQRQGLKETPFIHRLV